MPPALRRFLITALLLFAGWKGLYHGLLEPGRVIDRPMTNATAAIAAQVLSWSYPGVRYEQRANEQAWVYAYGRKAVGVGDPCNGLEVYALYVGLLLCLPASVLRKAAFILLPLPVLFWLNGARVAGIAWLNLEHRGWVDFSHHYVATTLMYGIIFGLWMWYGKGLKPARAGR
jgi:exosortase/archaeosortase family protein